MAKIGLDVKTLSRIDALRKRFQGDSESERELDSVNDVVSMRKSFESIKDSKAVKQIIKEAENVIKGINVLLETKEDMSEVERKILFHERRIHTFYLQRFDVNRIDQRLSDKIKFINEQYVLEFGDN